MNGMTDPDESPTSPFRDPGQRCWWKRERRQRFGLDDILPFQALFKCYINVLSWQGSRIRNQRPIARPCTIYADRYDQVPSQAFLLKNSSMPSLEINHTASLASNGNGMTNGKPKSSVQQSLPEAHQKALDACRVNLIKERLSRRQLCHSLSVRFVKDPEIAVMAADAGLQGILVDLEHSTLNLADAAAISCACLQAG
jgi:hypothetical protein